MAIIGTHVLINTPEPGHARSLLADVFGFEHVDRGDGWLIFRLPPAELAIHPSDGATSHAISFMCDDIDSTIEELRAKGLDIEGAPVDRGWGVTTTAELPGGAAVMIYQPRHPLAIDL